MWLQKRYYVPASSVHESSKSMNFGKIMIVNGNKLDSCGMGDIKLHTNSSHQITLKDALYCSKLQSNLLSIKRATINDFKVIFEKEICNFVKDNHIAQTDELNNNLYEICPIDKYGYAVKIQIICATQIV